MYKLLMASMMFYSLLSANNFPALSTDELFEEPSICEKIYSDCIDVCEKRSPSTFTNCLIECSSLYEECKEKNAVENLKVSKCKDSYISCSVKCEEKNSNIEQNKCSLYCEVTLDNCLDN